MKLKFIERFAKFADMSSNDDMTTNKFQSKANGNFNSEKSDPFKNGYPSLYFICPDTTSKIAFNDNKLAKDDIQFIIGPYEDYALSRAVELKEENESINISVLNVGLKENDSLLRRL